MNRLTIAAAVVAAFALTACNDDAQIASQNLSKAADNFEVTRRIVFYNGITDKYMLTVEGRCSIDTSSTGKTLHVICKTGSSEYKKHFLGLSDNVTFFAEQLESVKASAYHYRVTFKPQQILNDWDFRGSSEALKELVK
jgi:hypothetical protein